MRFKVIIAMVEEDHQEGVIAAAKSAGATGVTILNARGEGLREHKSFFGLHMEQQRDVLLFIVEDFHGNEILDAIYKAGDFHEKGHGIAFSWSVDRVVGTESQMRVLEVEAQEKYI
ncbi:MAG TPA: P-II family nitrogen regulator [Nitrospinota bacterium]|jgi:nitrogen regulatory protein PII|nr:P-II family nitrogen regulator [Nitrospinota bacterium]